MAIDDAVWVAAYFHFQPSRKSDAVLKLFDAFRDVANKFDDAYPNIRASQIVFGYVAQFWFVELNPETARHLNLVYVIEMLEFSVLHLVSVCVSLCV